MLPTILTIAGSDSSGGAGIQADLKAIAANGGYGASVVTAVTAQNTRRVIATEEVRPAMIRAQIDAVFDDLDVVAVKTGMLASVATIATVAEGLRARRPRWLVCDPVMVSESGHRLVAEASTEALLKEIVPLASVVTPNIEEAEALSGIRARTPEEAAAAGRRILARGARAVLVKGGHLVHDAAVDVLVTPETTRMFEGPRIDTPHTHGTGCTLGAAIATHLGRGHGLEEAIELSKRFVTEAIRGGFAVGRGAGPTDAFFFLRADADPPWLTWTPAPERKRT